MHNDKIRNKKGFIISDGILAILILMLFVGIITSLIYNIVLSSKRVKINSQEIFYMTDLFNHAEQIAYEDVTTEKLVTYVNEKQENQNMLTAGKTIDSLNTPYKMTISVEKYNETEGNKDKEDFIKIITVNIECELAGKNYAMEMKALKKIGLDELQDII